MENVTLNHTDSSADCHTSMEDGFCRRDGRQMDMKDPQAYFTVN